jgi:L-histidine Nalpha-methyltransferase
MSFADDVRTGLTGRPKTLFAKYFYDAVGSALFEAITKLPEYYLTRAESEILAYNSDDIVRTVGSPIEIVELGSGSSTKTRYLLDAAFRVQDRVRYRPIDISQAAIESSSATLRRMYPNIVVDAYAQEYLSGLKQLRRDNGSRALIIFLGSNVGNFEPEEAGTTLRAISGALRPGDAFLLGADLKKDPAVLRAAYDDALGVTAAFNKNILARINRELGGHFDLNQFRHRAWYNESASRVEMHLESARAQRVLVEAIDIVVDFDEGETIHTESSYKYDTEQLDALARDTGFAVAKRWVDPQRRFSSNLLVSAAR